MIANPEHFSHVSCPAPPPRRIDRVPSVVDRRRHTAPLPARLGRAVTTVHELGALTLVSSEPQKQARIADQLGLFSAHMVRVVNRLERRGLIHRRPYPGDRRAALLQISPAGEELARLAAKISARASADILGFLTPAELTLLDGMLRKLSGVER